MKKVLAFLLIALGLVAGACAEDACSHWVLCQNPTVCAECGEEGVSVPSYDVVHEWLFTDLGPLHMLYCLYCDYQEPPEEHFAMCDDPSVCLGCGAKGLQLGPDAIMHEDLYTDLGAQHQYKCTLCGYQDEPENHWAICDEPALCAGCGLIKLDIPEKEIYHEETYHIEAEWHQVRCVRCEYEEPQTAHVAVCSAPLECFYCKAPVDEAPLGEMLHFDRFVDTNITDTTHENYCTNCMYSWGVIPHRVNCADPTSCFACGKTGLNTADYTYYHAGPFAGMHITKTGHSFSCGQCNQAADNEAHTFDKEICYTCGYVQGSDAPDAPDVPDAPVEPASKPGDADGNGEVNILDALAVLQKSVGWSVKIDEAAADVDKSGAADILDALLILQACVGWDVELK